MAPNKNIQGNGLRAYYFTIEYLSTTMGSMERLLRTRFCYFPRSFFSPCLCTTLCLKSVRKK